MRRAHRVELVERAGIRLATRPPAPLAEAVDRGKVDETAPPTAGEVSTMRTIMKWIDGIVSKLARRKVQRDEGPQR